MNQRQLAQRWQLPPKRLPVAALLSSPVQRGRFGMTLAPASPGSWRGSEPGLAATWDVPRWAPPGQSAIARQAAHRAEVAGRTPRWRLPQPRRARLQAGVAGM